MEHTAPPKLISSSLCQVGLKDPSVFILKVAKEVDVNLTLV
jgi:hypothetical protein